MRVLFLHYPTCSTCRKARKWLNENGIDVVERHIADEPPTGKKLAEWLPLSGLTANRFFNTSGKKYREAGIKTVVKTASEAQLLELLADDGMLVKRPILVTRDRVLVGFREAEWKSALTGD